MSEQTKLPDPFDLDDDNATFAKLVPVRSNAASNRIVYAVVAVTSVAALIALALH